MPDKALDTIAESVDDAETAIDQGEPEQAKSELDDIRAAIAKLQADVEGVRGGVESHVAEPHQRFDDDDHGTLTSLAKDLRAREMAEHGPQRTHRRYRKLWGS